MEVATTINHVTNIMEALRSLILQDWEKIGIGYLVVAVAASVMLTLSVIHIYD